MKAIAQSLIKSLQITDDTGKSVEKEDFVSVSSKYSLLCLHANSLMLYFSFFSFLLSLLKVWLRIWIRLSSKNY